MRRLIVSSPIEQVKSEYITRKQPFIPAHLHPTLLITWDPEAVGQSISSENWRTKGEDEP